MRISLPNSKTFSKIFNESTGIKISESIKGIATDSREIQKINNMATKNKVLLNPSFRIVDLTKIKNIDKKIINSLK